MCVAVKKWTEKVFIAKHATRSELKKRKQKEQNEKNRGFACVVEPLLIQTAFVVKNA